MKLIPSIIIGLIIISFAIAGAISLTDTTSDIKITDDLKINLTYASKDTTKSTPVLITVENINIKKPMSLFDMCIEVEKFEKEMIDTAKQIGTK